MTRDIKATRDRLGLTTAGLATLVGVTPRSAQRWIEGTREVPEPVWRLLEAVMAHPDVLATLAFCDAWKARDRALMDGVEGASLPGIGALLTP